MALDGIARKNVALLGKWLLRYPLEQNLFGLLSFGINSKTAPIVRMPTTFPLPHTVAFGKASPKLYLFLDK